MYFFPNIWIIGRKSVILHSEIRVVPHRSGYSTIKKFIGTVSLANGGPQLSFGRAAMPVDYSSREHPYRVKLEFSPNHRHVPGFFIVNRKLVNRI